jgi:hypothetical protein
MPMTAEALPATLPCRPIARAVAVGMTPPRLAM